MKNSTLTGDIRYRLEKRLFRTPLLVLQVEEQTETLLAGEWPRVPPKGKLTVKWRDATIEDSPSNAPRVRALRDMVDKVLPKKVNGVTQIGAFVRVRLAFEEYIDEVAGGGRQFPPHPVVT